MDVVIPKPGRYVLAVSGGVDSMALLDILSKHPSLELVVAHIDHGIRPDSHEDRSLVESVADTLSVPCVCHVANFNSETSEAKAREVRYAFLRQVKEDQKAKAIITAHHQDDLIETAILNMLRGSGRKGLTSLKDQADILRPLIKVSKAGLIKYAQTNKLKWREDSTNQDTRYLRNYVRHIIVPKLDPANRKRLLNILSDLKETNTELDTLLAKFFDKNLSRDLIIAVPHDTGKEIMAEWLRQNDLRDFDRKTIDNLVVAAKTSVSGKKYPAINGWYVKVGKSDLALAGPER